MFTGFLRVAFDVVGYLFRKVEIDGKSVTVAGCRNTYVGKGLNGYEHF